MENNYVEKNYAIFQILIGKNGDKNFEQRLIDLIKQFIVGNIDKNNQHFNIPKDYILDLLTMSVVSIIYTWFDEETPRTSQEIIDIIIKTRFLSPVELIGEKVNV